MIKVPQHALTDVLPHLFCEGKERQGTLDKSVVFCQLVKVKGRKHFFLRVVRDGGLGITWYLWDIVQCHQSCLQKGRWRRTEGGMGCLESKEGEMTRGVKYQTCKESWTSITKACQRRGPNQIHYVLTCLSNIL